MRSSVLKSMKPAILVEMLENAFASENWDKMLNTSDILFSYAQCIYEERKDHKVKGLSLPLPLPSVLETPLPLVYYYGFSHLMHGVACQKQGHYDQAREYINKYAELGWLDDLGEEGLQLVEEFRVLAKSNLYTLDILIGKTEQAHKSKHDGNFRNCMALFESLRDGATEEQIRQYQEVLTASLE